VDTPPDGTRIVRDVLPLLVPAIPRPGVRLPQVDVASYWPKGPFLSGSIGTSGRDDGARDVTCQFPADDPGRTGQEYSHARTVALLDRPHAER
jgi:hypothetical protein